MAKTEEISLLINGDVLQEMFKYAYYAYEHFNSEIAGWGHYSEDKGIYKLAPLTKQEASRAEVDNFPNGILEDESYDMSDMMVQWHSHVTMDVFWSATDEKCIKDTLKLTKTLISVVVNVFGEYRCRVDSIVVGRQKHMVELNKQITQNCILQSYHNDKSLEKVVLRNLYKPKPIVQQSQPSGYWSHNMKTNVLEFFSWKDGNGAKRRWNQTAKRWEHNFEDKEDHTKAISTITVINTESGSENKETYWQKQRKEVTSNNKDSFVYLGKDSLYPDEDCEIYLMDLGTLGEFCVEWSKNGLSVNNVDYTITELKTKFGLK